MLASGATRRDPLLRRHGPAAQQPFPEPLTGIASAPSRYGTQFRRHKDVFRLTDTVVLMLVMAAAFLASNPGSFSDLQEFLSLRITMKNGLLLVAFVVLFERIFTLTTRPSFRAAARRHGELMQISAACTIAALVTALVPLTGLSTSFGLRAVLLFWVSSIPGTLAARRVAHAAVNAITRLASAREVIIVGSGPLAYAAYRSVCACREARCHVLGFVDTNHRIRFPEVRELLLGRLDELETILAYRNIDLVIIALPVKSQYSAMQEAIRICERVGVESRYLADIFPDEHARHEYDAEVGVPSVALKVVPDDVRTRLKRVFDVIAALVGLVLVSPVLAAIAIAIRLTSPGPVFFVQERFGLNRRVFRMYKFRTMVANAEALQSALEPLNEADGPVFKIRDDPRVTPLGRILRRTSLDELPQLFNVLKGDMSLVGPRPLPIRDVRHFSDAALMRRFSVRPGVTGLWQVSGRSNLDFDDWVGLDLSYIDQWSLGLDAEILMRTIPAVVRRTGAT